jgi:C4-type Zn-finger protein
MKKRKVDIAACPVCGSRRIGMGKLNSGVLFGVTSWKSVCEDCGYQGEPLLFDSEEEYKLFKNALEEQKKNKKSI